MSANAAKKPKRRVGRPSKLTKAIQNQIVKMLEQGNYLETAAAAVNIPPQTIRQWLAKGKGRVNKQYMDFRAAVMRAQAQAEARDIANIRDHGDHDWRATAWRLERRHPQRWRKRDQLDITGGLESRIVIQAGGAGLNPAVFGGPAGPETVDVEAQTAQLPAADDEADE